VSPLVSRLVDWARAALTSLVISVAITPPPVSSKISVAILSDQTFVWFKRCGAYLCAAFSFMSQCVTLGLVCFLPDLYNPDFINL
jgi:hypothetical protein